MYRVITKYRNGSERPIVERGPWHASHKAAEYWADLLRGQGYDTSVESGNGMIQSSGGANDNSALASMA